MAFAFSSCRRVKHSERSREYGSGARAVDIYEHPGKQLPHSEMPIGRLGTRHSTLQWPHYCLRPPLSLHSHGHTATGWVPKQSGCQPSSGAGLRGNGGQWLWWLLEQSCWVCRANGCGATKQRRSAAVEELTMTHQKQVREFEIEELEMKIRAK